MRNRLMTLVIGTSLLAFATMAAMYPRTVHSAPSDGISLLQTLSDWKYPGSEHLGDLSMSDAGTPPMQAVKCEAILVTPDPIEKVIAFYVEKLKKDAAKTISSQDDSKGRPLTLRVIVVNRLDTSTTLVISRAEGEKETHIAWSHYIRLPLAKRAEAGVRVSLSIYSGREDPSWEASDEEVKAFTAKLEALKVIAARKTINLGTWLPGLLGRRIRNLRPDLGLEWHRRSDSGRQSLPLGRRGPNP